MDRWVQGPCVTHARRRPRARSGITGSAAPAWLRTFVDGNPISHLVSAERGPMNGTATAGDIVWVLAASAPLRAVLAPLTMKLDRDKG